MRLLVAEDNTFLMTVYKSELTKAGFEVSGAEDGEMALQVLREQKPDLCLVDILMPKMDGFGFLEAKAKDPLIASVPVIMLSSLGEEADIERAKKLGAADYFLKSDLDMEKLVFLVKTYLPSRP